MSVVLWGPGERALAAEVVARRGRRRRAGAADGDCRLVALARGAAVMVSGDTGPTHIARGRRDADRRHLRADAARAQRSVAAGRRHRVARGVCQCHHLRRCRLARMCLLDIEVAEVLAAVERRLRRPARPGAGMADGALPRTRRRAHGIGCRAQARAARLRRAARWCCGWRSRRARSLARRQRRSPRRRGDPDLGRRAPEQVARGDLVGAVPLVRASALCRVVGDGRRARDRVARALVVAVLIALYLGDDADGGDQERGSVSAADVRRRYDRYRRGARGRAIAAVAAALQPGAGDGEPRAPRLLGLVAARVAARVEGNV